MSIYLVVKNAFETYVRGDLITDVGKVEKILASGVIHCVTKVIASNPKGQ
jgi:hypothetical protein